MEELEYERKSKERAAKRIRDKQDKGVDMLDIVKKCKEQEKEIERLKLVINDYIVDLIDAKISYNQLAREYKKLLKKLESSEQ